MVGAPYQRRDTVTHQRRANVPYQRRATVSPRCRAIMLIVVGSLLLFPVSLFYLVQDGVLAITPLTIVGGVVLIVGLAKRGRGPLDASDLPPTRPDLRNPTK